MGWFEILMNYNCSDGGWTRAFREYREAPSRPCCRPCRAGGQFGWHLAPGTACVLSPMPGWHPQAVFVLCEQLFSPYLIDLLFVPFDIQQLLGFIQFLSKT